MTGVLAAGWACAGAGAVCCARTEVIASAGTATSVVSLMVSPLLRLVFDERNADGGVGPDDGVQLVLDLEEPHHRLRGERLAELACPGLLHLQALVIDLEPLVEHRRRLFVGEVVVA